MDVSFSFLHKSGLLIDLALMVKIFNMRTDPFRHLTLVYLTQTQAHHAMIINRYLLVNESVVLYVFLICPLTRIR